MAQKLIFYFLSIFAIQTTIFTTNSALFYGAGQFPQSVKWVDIDADKENEIEKKTIAIRALIVHIIRNSDEKAKKDKKIEVEEKSFEFLNNCLTNIENLPTEYDPNNNGKKLLLIIKDEINKCLKLLKKELLQNSETPLVCAIVEELKITPDLFKQDKNKSLEDVEPELLEALEKEIDVLNPKNNSFLHLTNNKKIKHESKEQVAAKALKIIGLTSAQKKELDELKAKLKEVSDAITAWLKAYPADDRFDEKIKTNDNHDKPVEKEQSILQKLLSGFKFS